MERFFLILIILSVLPISSKANKFDKFISNEASGKNTSDMAEKIKQAKLAFEIQESKNTDVNKSDFQSSANICNKKLRDCMTEICDKNFIKCSKDGDSIFGEKLDKCRKNTNCSGEEFKYISEEIKTDRDFYKKIETYEQTLECGNYYNKCIINKCGRNFIKCLGKADSDKVIAECSNIDLKCKEEINGFSSKVMESFATLRQKSEIEIKENEKRLYELKDMMQNKCKMLGAMFDTRTLDCVYTVNFFANNSETPYSSKKTYAGSTFSCTPEWFGIDITTFKENAFRETRMQKSATSSFMGAGIGTGASTFIQMGVDKAMNATNNPSDSKTIIDNIVKNTSNTKENQEIEDNKEEKTEEKNNISENDAKEIDKDNSNTEKEKDSSVQEKNDIKNEDNKKATNDASNNKTE